ncbi:hypothetical protein N6H18_13985 [Reichenbachiella agarivorans]|uniref:Uncharacterized protein n=1 Tax=Reichenbachiella agarivorans TaxID=2979464 RepID=A0ABY6CLS0_9BACT|nr:hypothetical protein [Reichenbachiella agarivorans]UXP31460.1 hypothetical protein N6H18_13985 [Reichenbachiella agarivorans]
MNRLVNSRLSNILKLQANNAYSLIKKINIQNTTLPEKQIEFNVSHFLRRPIANMYSIVFEIGLEMNNKANLQRDLNFLKSLNKELSKAISKLETIIKEDGNNELNNKEESLNGVSFHLLA